MIARNAKTMKEIGNYRKYLKIAKQLGNGLLNSNVFLRYPVYLSVSKQTYTKDSVVSTLSEKNPNNGQ